MQQFRQYPDQVHQRFIAETDYTHQNLEEAFIARNWRWFVRTLFGLTLAVLMLSMVPVVNTTYEVVLVTTFVICVTVLTWMLTLLPEKEAGLIKKYQKISEVLMEIEGMSRGELNEELQAYELSNDNNRDGRHMTRLSEGIHGVLRKYAVRANQLKDTPDSRRALIEFSKVHVVASMLRLVPKWQKNQRLEGQQYYLRNTHQQSLPLNW